MKGRVINIINNRKYIVDYNIIMQEEHTSGGTQCKELRLINSGAFGCIYRPNLTCKGNVGSMKYLTKIQKSKRTIIHELRISEKVRKINGYARFFAPVLKHCPVRIAKDQIPNIKKCEVFKNETAKTIESTSYISMKSRYVGNQDLKAYLFSILYNSSQPPSVFLHELWQTHTHLLKGISKLYANNIVHYDLKYNNIIFDGEQQKPIIIDFGQSWSTTELKTEPEISAAFFVFDQYDYWCIDILICNYIVQRIGIDNAKNTLVNESEMNDIYGVFIHGLNPNKDDKIVNDAFLYNMLQNPQKKTNYTNIFAEYVRPFINNQTWWELYEDLQKYANTWDSYSLAIIYLNFLDDIFLDNSELYNRLLVLSENRLPKYIDLLEQTVYNAPNNRPTIQQIINAIEILVRK